LMICLFVLTQLTNVTNRHTDRHYMKAKVPRQKSSDFHEILYTAANFELDERHVIKNEKIALDRLRVRRNVFLVLYVMC